MDLGLKGLRALVAGSSRGLGYAVAHQLAAEECSVVINSRSSQHVQDAVDKLKLEFNSSIHGVVGNVSALEQPATIVRRAVEFLGGLDLLVTNAGGPPSGRFEGFSNQDWENAINLSFISHVNMIRAALPYLRESEYGAVLTITSYSVKQPIPNLILSNSIRAATVGLTKSLALELGNEGIRFNSILPGWTMTERVDELMASRAQMNNTSKEIEIRKQVADITLGRMADPVEFAKPAAFLLSPAASYITGVMLTVDGGAYKGTM